MQVFSHLSAALADSVFPEGGTEDETGTHASCHADIQQKCETTRFGSPRRRGERIGRKFRKVFNKLNAAVDELRANSYG
jgi:hypothetical protein